ncbi:MAG: TMEM165/GDT1 family protein [Candidatus Neomarinimicrobiota bacterium]|nr:MAG: TMEM165/GDT1 family protein [Candidatus Neomarinimicrobiota bacterium]
MKAIWIAFGTIFLAELGDKTQLAVLAMKGKGLSGWGIFIGTMTAFAVLTGLAVLVGEWLHARIPGEIIEKIAAASFVVIGVFMWFEKL